MDHSPEAQKACPPTLKGNFMEADLSEKQYEITDSPISKQNNRNGQLEDEDIDDIAQSVATISTAISGPTQSMQQPSLA